MLDTTNRTTLPHVHVVARMLGISSMTQDHQKTIASFRAWLELGQRRGWVSQSVCWACENPLLAEQPASDEVCVGCLRIVDVTAAEED